MASRTDRRGPGAGNRLPIGGRAVLLSLCLFWPALVPAADLKFITIDVAPWASRDAAGRAHGVFPEVIRELEVRTGHTIRMAFEPFARIERELEAGRQDCTIIVWDEARSRIVQRGAAVAPHPMGVIARTGVELRAYADLRPLVISVLRGAAFTPAFDTDDTLRKDFDTDYLIGIRKLAHGRVDAVAGAITTIRHLAREEGLGERLGDALVLAEPPLVLQCARSSAHLPLMPQLNRAVEAMVADGSVARIQQAHGF